MLACLLICLAFQTHSASSESPTDWLREMIEELNESGDKQKSITWKKILSCYRRSGNMSPPKLVRCAQLTWSVLDPINLKQIEMHVKCKGLDFAEEMIRRVHILLDLLKMLIAEFKLTRISIPEYLKFFKSVTGLTSIEDLQTGLTEMEIANLAEVGWLEEIPRLTGHV